MDNSSFVRSYNKIYRWLGLCIDMYSASEDEDDQKIAETMRKDPTEILEALIEIRMALITFKMANVTISQEGKELVHRSDFERMLKEFPPQPKDKWWPVWIRYIKQMDDVEWHNMWMATDIVIEDKLTGKF